MFLQTLQEESLFALFRKTFTKHSEGPRPKGREHGVIFFLSTGVLNRSILWNASRSCRRSLKRGSRGNKGRLIHTVAQRRVAFFGYHRNRCLTLLATALGAQIIASHLQNLFCAFKAPWILSKARTLNTPWRLKTVIFSVCWKRFLSRNSIAFD